MKKNYFQNLERAFFLDQAVGMLNTALAGYGQGQAERGLAAEAHDWAKEDAGHERMWQEQMSNSAHQREVKDLRMAGLNPILSGNGGAGAGGGSVGLPSIDRANAPDMSNVVQAGLNAAKIKQEGALMKAQEESLASAADASKAQARKTNKEADILGPQSYLYNKIEQGVKSTIKSVREREKTYNDEQRQAERDAKNFKRFHERQNLP